MPTTPKLSLYKPNFQELGWDDEVNANFDSLDRMNSGLVLTGATQDSRYVGATASGAPTTGTFAVGDFVVARNGKIWVCTVAGTPGTWVDVASGAADAPADGTYLVTTAHGSLSAEVVVGAAPGGELGGTWASPTVDATHSGSAHHTQSHNHSAAGDGNALVPATLTIPGAATPAQTAEGVAVWDTDSERLTIGTGSGRRTLVNGEDTPGGELGGSYDSPTVDATHSGSTHSAAADAHIADITSAHTPESVDSVERKRGGREAVVAIGATGTTETLDLANGNVLTATLDANCTFTMPSGLTSGVGIGFTLIITTSGASRTATFTGVKWPGGTAPVISPASGAVDIFSFLTVDGGTTWYGFIGGQAFA